MENSSQTKQIRNSNNSEYVYFFVVLTLANNELQ